MKKLLLKYWWLLPLLMVVLMLTLLLLLITVPTFFESVVGILLVLTLIAIIASWIVLGIHRQWWKCLVSIVFSILSFLYLGTILVMFSLSSPDGFARKHPIPEGLAYHIPLEENVEGPVVADSLDTENFLQIWNDFQGGIYRFPLCQRARYSCVVMRPQRMNLCLKTGFHHVVLFKSIPLFPFPNWWIKRNLPFMKGIGGNIMPPVLRSGIGKATSDRSEN